MSGKQLQKGGGFLSFVNSIITDKVNYTASSSSKHGEKSHKNADATKGQQQGEEDQNNDLALIKALQKQETTNSKPSSKETASVLRGSHGLGYQATQAEMEQATHIQRLKNQIKQQTQKEEEEVNIKKRIENEDDSRMLIGQKKQNKGDFRNQMIDEKQEKKRNKKIRQKNKRESQIDKIKEPSEAQEPAPQRQEREDSKKDGEELPQRQERVRIRTKTRSNQKNRKKDNRPIEVIRAKLAEKGIII